MKFDKTIKTILEGLYPVISENMQSVDRYMDAMFEDLYNITDDRVLIEKIRQRLETPEIKQKLGPANAGNLVEMVFKYIKDRQKKVAVDSKMSSTPAGGGRIIY